MVGIARFAACAALGSTIAFCGTGQAEDLCDCLGAPRVENVMRRVVDDPAERDALDRSITLNVRDNSGAPVGDADVHWLKYDSVSPEEAMKNVGSGRTGKDGVFTIRNLPRRGHHLHVSKGDVGWWGYLPLHAEEPNPVKAVTLNIYRSIEGRVVDERGAALGGVQLLVRRGLAAATTDAQGHFRIPNIDEQEQITVFKEGYGWNEVGLAPSTAALELRLEKGGRAVFTLLDASGKAAPDVSVSYWAADKDGQGTSVQTTSDSQGRFTTTWLPISRCARANAWFQADGIAYAAEKSVGLAAGKTVAAELRLAPEWRYVLDDTPDKNGYKYNVYTRINPAPSGRVSGRVTMADTGEPVAAGIGYSPSSMSVRGNHGRTAPDGSYSIDGLPFEKVYIIAVPDDTAYFCKGGLVEIDLSREKSIDGLNFVIEKGCAIRGTVQSAEGLPYRAHLRTEPDFENFPHMVWSKMEDGSFFFRHLPASADGCYTVFANTNSGSSAQAKVGPYTPGTVVENVVLRFSNVYAVETVLGTIRGIVVDTQDRAVPGAIVALPSEYSSRPATTDDAGRFELAYRKAGKVDLTVERRTSVQVDGMISSMNGPRTIVEGRQVVLTKGTPKREARVVVRAEDIHLVGGTIVDEHGQPFDPKYMSRYFTNGEATWHSRDGRFFEANFPEGPAALLFEHPGYRSVFLESGRDFQWGYTNIRVAMVKGPFPEFESVFQAVTGRPVSEKDRVAGGWRTWQHTPSFRFYAGNAKGIWLVVRNPEGKPIEQIAVRELRPNLPEILDRTQAATAVGVTRLNNPDGRYTLEKCRVFVSAPGYGWEWFSIPDQVMESEPNSLTLSPAATVVVTILDARGKPYAGVHASAVKMDPNWPRFIDTAPPYPVVGASGQITYGSLGPGEYTFGAWRGNSSDRRTIVLKVEPGKKYSVTLRFDQP